MVVFFPSRECTSLKGSWEKAAMVSFIKSLTFRPKACGPLKRSANLRWGHYLTVFFWEALWNNELTVLLSSAGTPSMEAAGQRDRPPPESGSSQHHPPERGPELRTGSTLHRGHRDRVKTRALYYGASWTYPGYKIYNLSINLLISI